MDIPVPPQVFKAHLSVLFKRLSTISTKNLLVQLQIKPGELELFILAMALPPKTTLATAGFPRIPPVYGKEVDGKKSRGCVFRESGEELQGSLCEWVFFGNACRESPRFGAQK